MEVATIVAASSRIYTFMPGVPLWVLTEDVSSVRTQLQALQGGTIAAPAAPTVATQGATGSATWGYKIAWVGQTGDSQLSPQGQATNGVTPLTGSNSQLVTRATVPAHVTGWRVVRTASGGSPAGINVDISGVLPASQSTFTDTGIAGSAYSAAGSAPPVDLVASGPADL